MNTKYWILICLIIIGYNSHAQSRKTAKERMFFYPEKSPAFVSAECTLSPNPASSLVQITLPKEIKPDQYGNFVLEVYDLQGIRLINQKWDRGKLDVSNFQVGQYIIVLRKDKLVYSQKLLVARE